MSDASHNHGYRLAWGMLVAMTLVGFALAWAIAHLQVTTFTLQPKPAASKATLQQQFLSTPAASTAGAKKPDEHLILSQVRRQRGLSFGVSAAESNQLAGSRLVTGTGFIVTDASNTAGMYAHAAGQLTISPVVSRRA